MELDIAEDRAGVRIEMAGVVIADIRTSFGAHDVIHGIDLTIESGEFCVFVGPSGCGKSTLLRIISGLEEATSGIIETDGTGAEPSERGIAMVFQSYALYPHLTVAENIGFGLSLARRPKDEIRRRVAETAQTPADRPPARPQAQGALRRPAPARRHRPRHHPRPQGLPLRRAAFQPRRGAALADAHRAHRSPRQAGRHDDLRHPRSGRGDDDGRQDRGAERRAGRAGGPADGTPRAPRDALRRWLHRQPAHEPL
jgi:hypothetical protein